MMPAGDGEDKAAASNKLHEAMVAALAKQRTAADALVKAPVVLAMSSHLEAKLKDTPAVFR